MSTFSTPGGLYERAQRRHRLPDGKTLFTYGFYEKHPLEAQAFFADIHLEAARARPAAGHRALGALMDAGRLQRHYTLNIDGLAERVGMDTWHPHTNPQGSTVEMHGSIHQLVCAGCGGTAPAGADAVRELRARRPVRCPACPPPPPGAAAMRFRVMLYEDADSEVITPEEVMDLLEADAKAADLILWVGISFQQSASTAYFRHVRRWLAEAGRGAEVVQAVVNPSDEALWNLLTACSNQRELNVLEVLGGSDEVLPRLAARLARRPQKGAPGAGGSPGGGAGGSGAAAPAVPLAAGRRAGEAGAEAGAKADAEAEAERPSSQDSQ
jgi:NAD-dependent SIR2 family protein deacetylase